MEKVRFAITKLAGQASLYWADVERNRKALQTTIDTWAYMKDELITKYVSSYFY